jgi:hypothetical protein
MTGSWQRYVAFWNEREAPEALALVRVTFGLALMANLAEQLLAGDILEYYALPQDGGIFPFDGPGAPLSLFHWLTPTATVVRALVYGQLAAALFLTVGLGTRLAALACLVLQITLYDRMPQFYFGGDRVFCVFSYLMLLAPLGAAWSLDARWFGLGRPDVPRWPRRLMMAQLAVIYVTTGLVKIGSTWSVFDGWSALYYAVNLPGIARWPGDWAAWVYPLTQVGTLVSKWFEITFFLVPLNLYLRRHPGRGGRLRRLLARWDLRIPYLAVGVGMHVSLTVLMDLGVFSIVMLSLYPCYLHPHEARAILRKVAALLPRRRPDPLVRGEGADQAIR